MFEKIDNLEIIYIFTGRKIIESEVIVFKKIDNQTLFVKTRNEGNLIFENSFKIKKGEQIFAINKNHLQSENILWTKSKIENLNKEIQVLEHNITKHDEYITACIKEQEKCSLQIQYNKEHIASLKEKLGELILNETSV